MRLYRKGENIMNKKLLSAKDCHYAINYLEKLGYEDQERMTVIDFMEKRVYHFETDTPYQRMKNYARIKEFNRVIREDLNNIAGDLHQRYSFDCGKEGVVPLRLQDLAIVGKSFFQNDYDKIDEKDVFDKTR